MGISIAPFCFFCHRLPTALPYLSWSVCPSVSSTNLLVSERFSDEWISLPYSWLNVNDSLCGQVCNRGGKKWELEDSGRSLEARKSISSGITGARKQNHFLALWVLSVFPSLSLCLVFCLFLHFLSLLSQSFLTAHTDQITWLSSITPVNQQDKSQHKSCYLSKSLLLDPVREL